MQGSGDAPPWFKADKYKTVDAQARAVPELEAKLGPAAELIGAPEGDYELPAKPEGLEGEFDADDPLLTQFREVAKELGLSQKAHDAIASKMAHVIAEQNASDEAALAEGLAKIGNNADARIAAVDKYLAATFEKDQVDALSKAIATDVNAYLAIEQLVAKASGDAQLAGGTGQTGPAFTKADAEAEMYKTYPEGHVNAGKLIYEHDAEHRAKVDGMFKQLFPGEDRQTVG